MSHLTKINIEVKNLDALRLAAARCGLEFHEGQNTYKWFGDSVGDYPLPAGLTAQDLGKCDHALAVPGNSSAYEVGVKSMPDGSYTLLWDFWRGGYGLQDSIGENGDKLITEYALSCAEMTAAGLGWMTERDGAELVIYHPDGGVIRVGKSGVDASGFLGADCVAACAPIEGAIGRESSRTLKGEFYQARQVVSLSEGEV